MSRYFTRPRAGKPLFVETPLWPDAQPLHPKLSVSDHYPVDTGLVDHRGDPIMRAPETMGFHHPRDKPMRALACLAAFLLASEAPPPVTVAHKPIPVLPDMIARAKFPKAAVNEVDALATVNRIVNQAIQSVSDKDHYGVNEMWVMFPADGKGDCEDFALTKLGIIANAGYPAVAYSRIRNVVIRHKGKPEEGHAILELRLPDSGEIMFLDSRFAEPMTRKELASNGYKFFDW